MHRHIDTKVRSYLDTWLQSYTDTQIHKGAGIFTGRSQYGARVMQVWLALACPKTLIVTLADVLESGNAEPYSQSS